MTKSTASRQNMVIASLFLALVGKRIQQLTGVQLTMDDALTLIGIALVAWHAITSFVLLYFPPPVPPGAPPVSPIRPEASGQPQQGVKSS